MEFAEDRRLIKERLETRRGTGCLGQRWSERGVCRPGG